MAIPAMALLQQHDACRDIVIEPAARRRAAIEARGHSELRAFRTGAQSGCKNPPACVSVYLSVCWPYCQKSCYFTELMMLMLVRSVALKVVNFKL